MVAACWILRMMSRPRIAYSFYCVPKALRMQLLCKRLLPDRPTPNSRTIIGWRRRSQSQPPSMVLVHGVTFGLYPDVDQKAASSVIIRTWRNLFIFRKKDLPSLNIRASMRSREPPCFLWRPVFPANLCLPVIKDCNPYLSGLAHRIRNRLSQK